MEGDIEKRAVSVQASYAPDSERGEDLLFQHFCNSLYLGQWELAKACAKRLQFGDSDSSISEILKDVVKQPFNRRSVKYIDYISNQYGMGYVLIRTRIA